MCTIPRPDPRTQETSLNKGNAAARGPLDGIKMKHTYRPTNGNIDGTCETCNAAPQTEKQTSKTNHKNKEQKTKQTASEKKVVVAKQKLPTMLRTPPIL